VSVDLSLLKIPTKAGTWVIGTLTLFDMKSHPKEHVTKLVLDTKAGN
jgi:hypothetical protein